MFICIRIYKSLGASGGLPRPLGTKRTGGGAVSHALMVEEIECRIIGTIYKTSNSPLRLRTPSHNVLFCIYHLYLD